MTISSDLMDHILSSGLFSGYQPMIGGLRDDIAAFKNAEKFVTIRRSGGAQGDPIYGEPIYQVMIGAKQKHVAEIEAKADAFIDFVNTNYQVGVIRNIVVQSEPAGPIFLSDDRSYFLITLALNISRG